MKRCRDGVTCVVLCVVCTLSSIYLVFGTAIPTSLYIFVKCFSYTLQYGTAIQAKSVLLSNYTYVHREE